MPKAESLIMGAGGVAFLGSFKQADGFPSNGYAIIAGTTALVFLASTTRGSALEKPVHAAAALMLLVALIRYVPGLRTTKKERKAHNG